MKLVEGTHYSRRLDQPSTVNFKTREYVDCLLCSAPSDSDDETVINNGRSAKHARQGIRLDALMHHYKAKHKDVFPAAGRSLLDMGFTLTNAGEVAEAAEATPTRLESDIMDDEVDEESARQEPAAQTQQPPPRSAAGPPIPTAIAINDIQSGQLFWRTLTSQVDTVIKANFTAQVIPSAHTIAMEVIKRGQESNVDEHGVGVSRERWIDHSTVPDMVRDSGMAYRATDDGGREVYCPVCLKYRAGDGHEVLNVPGRLSVARKSIARHLATQRHKQALAEEQREVTRGERRRKVGLNIARTALQTLREGASYVQFEHKLQSLHLAGVDIGSINHSREFIRGFVDSMTSVMDQRASDHVYSIEPVTGQK